MVKPLQGSLLLSVAQMKLKQSSADFESLPEELKQTYLGVASTAVAHVLFLRDLLSCSAINLVDEMKKAKLYRQLRKKYANELMKEVNEYEHRVMRMSGEDLDWFAERNETFCEQMETEMVKEYATIKNEIDRMKLPNSFYLARIHQTKVVCMTLMSAIDIWTDRMNSLVPPTQAPYEIKQFRPTRILHWINTLGLMEFSRYEHAVVEHPEKPRQADMNLAKRLADTELVCAIMRGTLRPSWMTEEAPNNSDAESVKE